MVKEGLEKVAKGLYENLKDYQEPRKSLKSKETGSLADGLKAVAEEMKRQLEETLATSSLTGVYLHERIIQEKAEVLADLGVLREVFHEVELLDEEFNTNMVETLDRLTLGLL